MDCEKYEPLLIDELYDELDEVTSAAVKRHVAGCAKCAAILNGMKATRAEAVLPVVALPAGLEDRILAAAKDAQKVVPIQSRFGRALSMAGRWAMRPQTAMAAVFLLMIGSSAFLIRAKKDNLARPSAVSVTEQGAPDPQAPAPPATDTVALSSPAAASAHGPSGNANWAAPPPPVATVAPPAELAMKESVAADKDVPAAKPKAAGDDLSNALATAQGEEKKVASRSRGYEGDPSNAGYPAGAPVPATQAPYAAAGAGAAQAPAQTRKADMADGFSQGMASYRARNFVDATKQFDSAAQTGDLNAALWAAKSVKDGNGGCGAALPRFESVAQRASGSWTGNEASLEAARCQIALGRLDAARNRLNALAQVPSHAQQAQTALGELNQVAAGKGGGGTAGGMAAPKRAAPAPVRAPAAPAKNDETGF